VLLAIHVQEDLAVEHVHGLVCVGMRVQRRSLALVESVFEKEERTIRLLGRGLPEVHTAAVEPAPLTFLDCADDRSGCRQVDRSVHGAASLAGVEMLWD